MENLEEEAQETLGVASTTNNQTTSNAIDFDLTPGVGSILSGTTTNSMPGGALEQDFDDSLILIQPRIDVVDLTTSPSTSTSAGTGATLLKPKIEDPSGTKDNITTSNTTTITTTENPSTSTGASTDGVAATTTTNSITSNLLECPICLQTCIHPARLPCGHIFCFLCVKGVAYKNRRCAMCRREIPPEFLDHPQLVNGIEDICTTKATDDGYQWFYEGRNGGWWAYDKRSALEIEEVFQMLQQKQQQKQETVASNVDEVKEEKLNVTNPQAILTPNQPSNQHPNEVRNDGHDIYDDEIDDEYDDDTDEDEIQSPSMLLNDQAFTYNIQICGSMYTLDFKNMIQYPQHMSYRKRKICRAKGLPAKGVAGIVNSSRRRYRNRRRPYDINLPF